MRSADPEAVEPFRNLVRDIDGGDGCPSRARPAPRDGRRDPVAIALEDRLDPAVRQIADPAVHAERTGLGPSWASLREAWREEMATILGEAGLALPADGAFRSEGKRGRHSEHMGYILAEMQYLQRAYPGGAW